MNPCIICEAPGHSHHIVYRSHGGLDNKLNRIDLCPVHHNLGPDSPHRNHLVDISYKTMLQEQYFELFEEGKEYSIKDIAGIIGMSERKVGEAFRKVNNNAGMYSQEDIVRRLMGGRLY